MPILNNSPYQIKLSNIPRIIYSSGSFEAEVTVELVFGSIEPCSVLFVVGDVSQTISGCTLGACRTGVY